MANRAKKMPRRVFWGAIYSYGVLLAGVLGFWLGQHYWHGFLGGILGLSVVGGFFLMTLTILALGMGAVGFVTEVQDARRRRSAKKNPSSGGA